MPTTMYGNGGVSPRTNVYAEQTMLRHAQPVIVLDKLGLSVKMPKNKTDTIKFRRPNVFTAATIPLQEGVTPTASQFTYTDVGVQLQQYGHLVEVTDKVEDTHEDPVITHISEQSGENIGRTLEAVTYGVVRGGTNVFYQNGSVRTDVNTPISLAKVRAVVRGLKAQKAMPITKVLSSSVDYATRAVEPAFVCVSHTDGDSDIRALPGFLPVAQYGQRSTVHDNELGTVENVRFVTSPDLNPFLDAGGAFSGSGTSMVTTSGTSADIYPFLFFGKEAFGCVALRGMGAVEPTIIRPGVKDKSDPLGQRGYIGWKTWFACLILNDVWQARLECAVTAL